VFSHHKLSAIFQLRIPIYTPFIIYTRSWVRHLLLWFSAFSSAWENLWHKFLQVKRPSTHPNSNVVKSTTSHWQQNNSGQLPVSRYSGGFSPPWKPCTHWSRASCVARSRMQRCRRCPRSCLARCSEQTRNESRCTSPHLHRWVIHHHT